ncbi:MAG: SPOR domain-containing protein [Bacteroidetes bacterium]|nr:SPOR domain-containing protein [Bacteroidota bacterium]
MNIASYISELLFEHECVVIPGFGGFIVNDRPATVNRITHQFSPPFRKVMFNIHLSANDGLLINHIANMDHISYVEAKQMVIDFAKHCQEELKSGNKINFINIGSLYKNKEGHITFEQNEQVNYNHDAFGLGSFYSPPVERASDEERIKGIVEPLISGKLKPRDRKPFVQKESGGKRRKRAGVVVLVLFILLLSIGGGFTFKEHATSYWQNYAMLIPVFNTENTPISPRTDSKTIRKEIPVLIDKETADADLSIKARERVVPIEEEIVSGHEIIENATETKTETAYNQELPKEEHQVATIKPQSGSYMIITGSFSEESNALKLVDQLKQSGIGAVIADTSKNGMYRVAYAVYNTLDEAKDELYAIRNQQYPDAWILKKK